MKKSRVPPPPPWPPPPPPPPSDPSLWSDWTDDEKEISVVPLMDRKEPKAKCMEVIGLTLFALTALMIVILGVELLVEVWKWIL